MGNYEQLKQAISDVIKMNGNQEITGTIMQNSLLTIISTVGDNSTFAGIATPDTNPGTPDQNVFYIASKNGIYSNFGGITIKNKVAILTNTNGTWKNNAIDIPTFEYAETNYNEDRIFDNKLNSLSGMNIFPGQLTDRNVWNNLEIANHFVLPIKVKDTIQIVASDNQPVVYAILKDYYPVLVGENIPYADGTTRNVVLAKSKSEFTVSNDDAKYIAFNVNYKDLVYTPKTLIINGYNYNEDIRSKIVNIQGGNILKSASQFKFMGHSEIVSMNSPYLYFPCYGQSLSNGSDSLFVDDNSIYGNYMIGNIQGLGDELVPLKLTTNSQHPIVSCINSLSVLYRNYYDKSKKFIAASLGLGGRSIAQLSKASTIEKYAEEYNYPIKDSGAYENRFLLSIEKAISIVGQGNIMCPVIIYLQGERDYVADTQQSEQPGSVDAAYACNGDKEKYKERMMNLKNDMQNDIMEKFNQNVKPIFCIYQVSGSFIKNDQMTINMAQVEFAEENEDVYILQSPYFVPNYNTGHLTTNGYRWYGEFIAKYLFSLLFQNSKYEPIYPFDYKIENDKIHIYVNNNIGKLQLDTTLVEESQNFGFAVFINSIYNQDNISNINIVNNIITITCNQDLSNKKVELVYAGNKTNGSGNIRDNDVFQSMYKYWDDTNDRGQSGDLTISYKPNIIGKKYPMYNWMNSFYKLLQNGKNIQLGTMAYNRHFHG